MMVLLTRCWRCLCCSMLSGRAGTIGAAFSCAVPVPAYGHHGRFLTGDLFNLFVFFRGAADRVLRLDDPRGRQRAAAGRGAICAVQPDWIDLFLFALGAIYAETGTLNMADLAQRVRLIGPKKPLASASPPFLLLWSLRSRRACAAALLAAVQLSPKRPHRWPRSLRS